jgi:mono/diheme cytochrome c family protein
MKPRTVLTALSAVAAAGVLGTLGFGAIAWQTEIPAIAPPKAADFDPATIRRGAALVAIGDCVVCHTAERGLAFAGGRALETPFGTLYATNITPDERTGIGNWSAAAFRRAMRDGVSRDGEHLYPALPYEHFTRVTDADLDAIYAFLMTRDPVSQETPENKLIPPLGFRPLLAGWKLLFPERRSRAAGRRPERRMEPWWRLRAAAVAGAPAPRLCPGGDQQATRALGFRQRQGPDRGVLWG